MKKNGKVNKLRIFKRFLKRNKYRLIVGAITLSSITAIGLKIYGDKKEAENKKQIVTEYYGKDSQEVKILDYIEVSKKLDKLDLDKYKVTDAMFEEHNIFNLTEESYLTEDIFKELKSVDEIEKQIEKFNNINSNSKNLDDVNDFIKTVLQLKTQTKLVNRYLYDIGYDVSNKNMKNSLQKYTAEVLGIEDSSNISFGYDPDINGDDYYLYLNNNEFKLPTFFSVNDKIKEIKDGIEALDDTYKFSDPDYSDNDKYLEERNAAIKEALYKNVELNQEVENEDLYDEKLASKYR